MFLLSGLFIALASCLTVYDTGLDPHMGMNVLVSAMVAMIIGGIGNFSACVLGGLLLGILQSLAVYFCLKLAECDNIHRTAFIPLLTSSRDCRL